MNGDDIGTVEIVLYEGFDEIDAIGPYEVLANAATVVESDDAYRGDGFTVSLVALEPTDAVTGSHGLRVEPDGTLGAPDLLVVPGGGWNDRAERGAWGEAQRGDLPDAVARRAEGGATVASVCTGGMVLAAGGLVDGRPAVTHRGALDDLAAAGAAVVDARVVDDGDLLTAGGVTAGFDLAFHLVERSWGADVAARVAAEMEYERRGSVHET